MLKGKYRRRKPLTHKREQKENLTKDVSNLTEENSTLQKYYQYHEQPQHEPTLLHPDDKTNNGGLKTSLSVALILLSHVCWSFIYTHIYI